MQSHTDITRLAGYAGLLGAVFVGLGEFVMQFTPNGGLEDMKDYLFFNDISPERLSLGHFFAVLTAPLYIAGYWFLSRILAPAGSKLAMLFFLIGGYAFAVGTAWIGQRYFIASTVHAINDGANISELLADFSEHNEPLVNVLRVAMVLVSIIWIKLIFTGKTRFPKWMSVLNPIVLLALIFALYFFDTLIGLYLFPMAMNVTHIIIFALALYVTAKPDRT